MVGNVEFRRLDGKSSFWRGQAGQIYEPWDEGPRALERPEGELDEREGWVGVSRNAITAPWRPSDVFDILPF